MFPLRCLGVVAVSALAVQDPCPSPPMPFHDLDACPFECCVYRDWRATKRMNAWASYDATGAPRVFSVAPGERVTAMTGVVVTSEPGVLHIRTPLTLEVRSRRFPRRPAENIRLEAGDTLYILAKYGEGALAGWFKGRLFEAFDGDILHPLDAVREREGEPVTAWWVKIRNSRGLIGWVRGEDAFRDPAGC
jgi:hypothetical protein